LIYLNNYQLKEKTKAMKVGLWLPQRKNLSSSITMENPAHVDERIYKMFCEHLNKMGVEYVENLDFRKALIHNNKVYIGDFCLSELDHFVWMGMLDRSYNSYHLEVLRVLELSTKVHNSHSFYSVATDKFTAFSILHQHNIPVSELYLVSKDNYQQMEPLFQDSSFLLKPRRAAFGIGIVKIDDYQLLRDIVGYSDRKDFYLEKFYPNNLSEWTGVTVFNGEILLGFRKKSSKLSGWKVYDEKSIGGETLYVKPDAEIEAIAINIGKILSGNYFGLDFIKTDEGYKVVDINCSPGMYYDFVQEMDLPIAEMFFKMLFE
jgi:ribosomal protein S6--L-glutamate ligase